MPVVVEKLGEITRFLFLPSTKGEKNRKLAKNFCQGGN